MWHSIKIGQQYFVCTVTKYYTGRIVKITETDIVLAEASWIPDTGRLSEFMRTGVPRECEPYLNDDEVIVSRGAIVDAVIWRHELPREVI